MTSSTQTREKSRGVLIQAAAAIATTAVVGSIACLIIATIARAAGVSDKFHPLDPSAYISLVIFAAIIGAIGWILIIRRATDPARVLSRLVPIVIVVSLVPDLLVGFGKSMAHTSWGGIVALMIMHLVVAAVAVTSYRRFLPPPR